MSNRANPTVYERVTDRIINLLEQGTVPWVRPWKSPMPHNAVSGHPYQGINTLNCMALELERGFECSSYVTFQQARQLSGWVRQGEHGVLLVLYKRVTKQLTDKDESDANSYYFLAKSFTAFNLLQCGGLDHLRARLDRQQQRELEPLEECEQVVGRSGAVIHHLGDRAFYSPSRDEITVPPKHTFHTSDACYSTLLHELTHWTGAPHRLNRQRGERFGDERYAFEELVAELGAAYLSARCGIEHVTQAAAYLQSWLQALRDEKRFIFVAAKLASEAANYLYPAAESPAGIVVDSFTE